LSHIGHFLPHLRFELSIIASFEFEGVAARISYHSFAVKTVKNKELLCCGLPLFESGKRQSGKSSTIPGDSCW